MSIYGGGVWYLRGRENFQFWKGVNIIRASFEPLNTNLTYNSKIENNQQISLFYKQFHTADDLSYEWEDVTIQDKNIAHFELISFQNRKAIEEFATGSIAHILRTSNKTSAYHEVIPGYSWLVGVCRMFPETLTLFPTKLCGFPTLVCV